MIGAPPDHTGSCCRTSEKNSILPPYLSIYSVLVIARWRNCHRQRLLRPSAVDIEHRAFPYSSGSKGTAAKIKLASDPFLVSFFSHVSSGSSGFFAYFFMPSQILCAFLQVCALFFLAIKFELLWSRERHNALSNFHTHITTPRLWHNIQQCKGENCSWSSQLSLGLWRQSCTYASSSCP